MKKKIIMSFLAAGLLGNSLNLSLVKAEPIPSNTNISNSIESQIEEQIQKADNEICNTTIKLQSHNIKIEKLEKDIASTEKALNNLSKDITVLNDLSKKRMRTMYMNGNNQGYLQLVLDANGISDLIDKVSAVNTIIEFDKNNLKKLKESKISMENNKNKLLKDKKEAVELKEKIDKDLQTLNSQKESEKKLLEQVKGCSEEEAKIKVSLSRGSFSAVNNDVVNFSFNYLGLPYLWGGTSPETGFDCSGFVQYIYAHFGVDLPRISEEQQNCGLIIQNREDLKPGDLIFFGRPAHHVGMYIGDGKYIHSPHTGDVIKISALGDFTSASRVK